MSKKFENSLPFKLDKLIKKEEEVSAIILDAEQDMLECEFDNSETVTINTKDYEYITLTLENLETLKKLIYKSEKYYNKYFDSVEK
jgi:hypothetical protein